MRKGLWAPSLVLSFMLFDRPAFSDDRAACLEAASKGQTLRDAHELVEAREELLVCAGPRCPAVVQADCINWLEDVQRALPTVVISAKDASGADLVDVRVSMDDQPLLPKIDGLALPVDPGPHAFRFESKGRAPAELRVLIKEGEKSQSLSAVLGPSPQPTRAGRADDGSATGWKTLGWALAGAGMAGLGLGAVSGVAALVNKSAAHCMSNDTCDPGSTGGIKTAAILSDAGWIAGSVLLASGTALVLFSDRKASSSGIRVVSAVTPAGAGIVMRATW
ncbi:MAG: hypothetical protein WBY94_02130 [Polyangiaceae bacterium]